MLATGFPDPVALRQTHESGQVGVAPMFGDSRALNARVPVRGKCAQSFSTAGPRKTLCPGTTTSFVADGSGEHCAGEFSCQ